MAGDNYIDFNTKFTKILNKNIKLEDILTSAELANSEVKAKFYSIFKLMDDINPDGELDSSEISDMIRYFDSAGSNDKKISDNEIKAISKYHKFDRKIVKEFLQRIHNMLLGETSKENIEGWDNSRLDYDSDYKMNKTQYGNEYISYTSQTGQRKQSAILDIKNDTLLTSNINKQVQIVGVKAFLNGLQNGVRTYPKIIINTPEGKKEIEVSFNTINISSASTEDDYIHILTHLINNISNLPPNVLEDLVDNVKRINIQDLIEKGKPSSNGAVEQKDSKLYHYSEIITLNPKQFGVSDIGVLIHEIGHTVDATATGYTTMQDKEAIEEFLKKLPRDKIPNADTYEGNHVLKTPWELYAGFYANRPAELFKFLEDSGDAYGWPAIKEKLSKVKEKSNLINQNYREAAKAFEARCESFNNEENPISQERLEKYNPYTLWDELYKNELIETIKNIINKDKDFASLYKNTDVKRKIELIKAIRNHPEIKPILKKFLDNSDAEIKAKEVRENLPFEEALAEVQKTIEQTTIDYGYKPLSKNFLDKVYNQDNTRLQALLNSEELRKLINDACAKEAYSVPRSLREKYNETSNEPITKEVLMAFHNDGFIRNFLIREMKKPA